MEADVLVGSAQFLVDLVDLVGEARADVLLLRECLPRLQIRLLQIVQSPEHIAHVFCDIARVMWDHLVRAEPVGWSLHAYHRDTMLSQYLLVMF